MGKRGNRPQGTEGKKDKWVKGGKVKKARGHRLQAEGKERK
jgi:hypothetical protein